jgi:hypothetical protein
MILGCEREREREEEQSKAKAEAGNPFTGNG